MIKKQKGLLIAGGIGAVLLMLLLLVQLTVWGMEAKGTEAAELMDTAEPALLDSVDAKEDVDEAVTVTSKSTATQEPEPTLEPTLTPEPTDMPTPDMPRGPYGPEPDDFPAGVNPLTGEMAVDPITLDYLPALVSITNWPVTARPQAGIGSASWIYEMYIGQGMSRFLTLFYGEFPGDQPNNDEDDSEGSEDGNNESEGEGDQDQTGAGLAIDNTNADSIGPIRSGRLPYENLRVLNNGFLVMASGYSGVIKNLDSYTNVYGSDDGDINSAMIPATQLKAIAGQNAGDLVPGSLSGNLFSADVPSGGQDGETFWFIYNTMNQIAWRYDSVKGVYYRFADQADGKTFVRLNDRLTDEPVEVSNVILLYANHRFCTEKAFDIDFMNISKAPAVLFRDGQKFDIFWTTKNGEFEVETGKNRPIRFIDAEGNPFALKPGSSWVILVPNYTPIWEAPLVEDVPYSEAVWLPEDSDTLLYSLLSGKEGDSGVWVSRFYQSLMVYDANVCAIIK